MAEAASHEPLSVAVVGGGLMGLVTTIGLLTRGVRVRLYEGTAQFDPASDCIGITPNAERAMKVVHPGIYEAFKKLARPNEWAWSQYADGEHPLLGVRELFRIHLGEDGFERCLQNDLLIELASLIAPGTAEFNKRLVCLSDLKKEGPVVLRFSDGTQEFADIVIGCDGIWSQVRRCLFGYQNPVSVARYSGNYMIKALVDLDAASKAVGRAVTSRLWTHLGEDAHLLTFPVGAEPSRFLNVVGFVSDHCEWQHPCDTVWAAKVDIVAAFAKFGPTVRGIVDLLPPVLEKQALYDHWERPARSYAVGRVTLAGDAAHAAMPYQGVGPGLAVEDAAALCTLMAEVEQALRGPDPPSRHHAICHALETYNLIRRQRCEWLVDSSRFVGHMYEWQTPHARDAHECCKEVQRIARAIWDYDVNQMVRDCQEKYEVKVTYFWAEFLAQR